MDKITPYIDEEYYDLVARPSDESMLALKLSIKQDGQQEPIVVNSEGAILDGHSRFTCCNELGIECNFTIRDSKSKQEEINYLLIANSKRRNLTNFQLYDIFEEQINNIQNQNTIARVKRRKHTNLHPEDKLDDKKREKSTRTLQLQASELTGLSTHNILMIRYLKKHASYQTLHRLKNGSLTLVEDYKNEQQLNEDFPTKTDESESKKYNQNDKYIVNEPVFEPELKSTNTKHKITCPRCKGTGKITI